LLLRNDAAIDTIWRKLRALANQLSGRGTEARNAVAAALRYIRSRKAKVRYAARALGALVGSVAALRGNTSEGSADRRMVRIASDLPDHTLSCAPNEVNDELVRDCD
jgi:hypothetical protein